MGKCICPTECDCQRPAPAPGQVRMVSDHCRIHNDKPTADPDCPHWGIHANGAIDDPPSCAPEPPPGFGCGEMNRALRDAMETHPACGSIGWNAMGTVSDLTGARQSAANRRGTRQVKCHNTRTRRWRTT